MPGMGRRKMVGGDEYDAYTRWRHLLIYMGRSGVRAQIKAKTHRRERKEAKRQIRDE